MKNLTLGILGILAVLLFANIGSAEIVGLDVIPVGPDFAVQGGTIDYRVIVTMNEPVSDGSIWLREVFSILDERVGWTYSFAPTTVTLDNTLGDSREAILTITVPDTASVGTYSHTVGATGTTEFDESMGIEGGMFTTRIIDTPIAPVPELNTGILTSLGMVGLFVISRRFRRE